MKYYNVQTLDGLGKAIKSFKNKKECIKWIAEANSKSSGRWTWSENYFMNLGAGLS